ncbi:dihydropteroate synthase [Urbifossiella limnaea]|uniref:Dihydropteroate synthase n=1 Tax=Urbifossiella limnaea TaxID=2528023 RepID=A0A517XUP8_9BACT|nr:dihydropteroate synthase [Urbifossiella limnaea]QDU21225.1 Dihydropteroate synthase [Urbifossiella limnaea]
MPRVWVCRGHQFTIGPRPLVMGIVNVTPDSFSDGGRFLDPAAAIDHGLALAAEGANILDIGGESTRPGAPAVSGADELARVLPVVAGLAKRAALPLSVDTTKAEVARRCMYAGASIINDVSGLTADADMPGVVAATGAGVVVMHMQGTPRTMQQNPVYGDVVGEVAGYLEARLHALAAVGISPDAVCLDPGIGFGKTLDHNLTLLAHLDAVAALGRPVCLGVSRKKFIGTLCGREPADRAAGSLAVATIAAARGTAQVLRVHDVAATRDAVVLLAAINRARRPDVAAGRITQP